MEEKKAETEVKWSPDQMLEISLAEPDDFLKVRETLTRIGIASKNEKKLCQSVHILHKRGRYFLVHFKELFLLDGKTARLEKNDLERRNTIATLLADWGLLTIVGDKELECAPLRTIKIIPFKEKSNWTLESKYTIGKVKKNVEKN